MTEWQTFQTNTVYDFNVTYTGVLYTLRTKEIVTLLERIETHLFAPTVTIVVLRSRITCVIATAHWLCNQ